MLINNLEGHDKHQTHGLLNDLGWEIYPEGLYDTIMQIKTRWNKPVMVTENGIADLQGLREFVKTMQRV